MSARCETYFMVFVLTGQLYGERAMRRISLALLLIAGMLTGFLGLRFSWSQTMAAMASDNETMENKVIHDEGYGNTDAEYYGSKDDLVNDEMSNDKP